MSPSERPIEYMEVRSLVHDLTSPVTSLKINLQLLEAGVPKGNHYVKRALQGISQLEKLLTASAKLQSQNHQWSINKVISDCIRDHRQELDEAVIDCRFNSQLNCKLSGPRIVFYRIIANLLTNSIKSLKNSKGIDRNIEILCYRNRTNFFINFSDNGAGIPQVIAQQLFEKHIKRRRNGHGFGLFSVAQNLQNLFGGTIKLVGQTNQKTMKVTAKFRMVLPIS